MICSGCGEKEAAYRVTGDEGTTVFMCEECYSNAKGIAQSEGIPVSEVEAEKTISVCSQCGKRAWEHHLDKDGYICAFVCLGCGAMFELEE